MPPGLRLTFKDCLILLYVEQHPSRPYDQWPVELRVKAVEKLRRRGYLLRGYWPIKFTITRRGFSLVEWIKSSLEHVASSTASAAQA